MGFFGKKKTLEARINFNSPPWIPKAFKRMARDSGVSMSQYIREACVEFLEKRGYHG